MSGGGGSQSTTTTQSGPPASVEQAYTNLTNAATGLASNNPLQQYTAPIVSGFTPQQQLGFSQIAGSEPYVNSAAQEFGAATAPIYQTEGNYLSPYTQDVTGALT